MPKTRKSWQLMKDPVLLLHKAAPPKNLNLDNNFQRWCSLLRCTYYVLTVRQFHSSLNSPDPSIGSSSGIPAEGRGEGSLTAER